MLGMHDMAWHGMRWHGTDEHKAHTRRAHMQPFLNAETSNNTEFVIFFPDLLVVFKRISTASDRLKGRSSSAVMPLGPQQSDISTSRLLVNLVKAENCKMRSQLDEMERETTDQRGALALVVRKPPRVGVLPPWRCQHCEFWNGQHLKRHYPICSNHHSAIFCGWMLARVHASIKKHADGRTLLMHGRSMSRRACIPALVCKPKHMRLCAHAPKHTCAHGNMHRCAHVRLYPRKSPFNTRVHACTRMHGQAELQAKLDQQKRHADEEQRRHEIEIDKLRREISKAMR